MDLEIAFMQELQDEFHAFNWGEQSLTVFYLMLEAYLRALKKSSGNNFIQIQCGKILHNRINAHFETKYEEEQKGLMS